MLFAFFLSPYSTVESRNADACDLNGWFENHDGRGVDTGAVPFENRPA